MTKASLERDFVGYAGDPPDPKWPGGARIAVNFVMNYEEGSEYSLMDQDGLSDAGLTELASSPVPPGARDLGPSAPARSAGTAATALMMSVGMHMRLLGHPGRPSGLERFLDYIATKPDVWVARRLEIARHWLTKHPPQPPQR